MPTQVTIHAGIHKSGTTSIQQAWRTGFASVPDVLYPEPRILGPGHAETAFAERDDDAARRRNAHLEELMRGASTPRATIEDHVRRAADLGVDHLVLSSEEFGLLDRDGWERVMAVTRAERTVIVFTVSPPSHRWFSTWQELVKFGLAARPVHASATLGASALLEPGALERVLTGPRAAKTVVRLVRTAPPEPHLALNLAEAAGLPAPCVDAAAPEIANASLGALGELLRLLNEQGETLGLLDAESIGRFEAARDSMAASDAFAAPRADFTWSAQAESAARSERGALAALARRGIEVLDPHTLLASWAEPSMPGWVDEVARRAWAPYTARSGGDGWTDVLRRVADAAAAEQRAAAAERRRQALERERDDALGDLAAARRAGAAADGRAATAAAALASLCECNRDLEREAAAIRGSRSWRAMAPLRHAAGALRTMTGRG